MERREIDIGSLVSLTGRAVDQHVLARLHDSGHRSIRAVHGYVFQRLLVSSPTIGELAAQLRVTQQRASTLVAGLESAGYVIRTLRPGDARIREVRLTDAGRDVVALARAVRSELEQQLGSEHELPGLRAALDRLLELTGSDDAVRRHEVPIPAPEV